MYNMQSRRRFLGALSGAAAASLVGAETSRAAEAPPETRTVRIAGGAGAICVAPQYVAEELLRDEGFTDVRVNVDDPTMGARFLHDKWDFELQYAPTHLISAEAGERVTVLTGVHPACFELL